MLGGYVRSVIAAVIWFCMTEAAARPAREAPAEIQPASADALFHREFSLERTAMVLSLWAGQPGQQCAVTPRYVMAPDDEVITRILPQRAHAFSGARALQQKLETAGFAPAPVALDAAPAKVRRAA